MRLLLFFFLCPVFCFSETEVKSQELPVASAPSSAPGPQLFDVFESKENPGVGALSYKLDDEKTEKIAFGKTSGIYGLGMIFSGKALPPPFDKDFQKSEILQLALGVFKTKDDVRIPQFGAVTFLGLKPLSGRTVYRLTTPNSSELKKGAVALLLFASPSLQQTSTDEDKLKETMFAEGGSIIVTPFGEKTVHSLKSKEGKIAFYRRWMRFDWSAQLATPFTNVKRTLVGTTEFPVFWPKDAQGERYAMGIAKEAITSVAPASKGAGGRKASP